MSDSFTISESKTFTITHAKKIASKVKTDLDRIRRYYGSPSTVWIKEYEVELIELLINGYLDVVVYGFKRDGSWIPPTLEYASDELYYGYYDDDPGRIKPGHDVSNANFTSYLKYSTALDKLTASERDRFKKGLPFYRNGANEPSANGYFERDKTYSAGGRALNRSILRPY